MPKTHKKVADKSQLITDELLKLLAQDTLPWRRPWQQTPYLNAITGKLYNGLNPLLVQVSVLARGYSTTLFVGFNQAKAAGWQMRKGSKATYIRAAGQAVKREEDEDGQEAERSVRFVKWLAVFNLDCFTDDEHAKVRIAEIVERYVGELNAAPRIEDAEAFVESQKATVQFGGDRAFYSPAYDRIHLPGYERFSSAESYYATYLHELAHWTGHASRLNRDIKNRFGTADYAFEELVAEIGAAIVCGHLGLTPELENHASYLKSWQKLLSGDSQAFLRAATLAQQAAELMMSNAGLLKLETE